MAWQSLSDTIRHGSPKVWTDDPACLYRRMPVSRRFKSLGKVPVFAGTAEEIARGAEAAAWQRLNDAGDKPRKRAVKAA